jgi:hypothetical protein
VIFITVAECARCGGALKVYPGTEDGPGATGDLYLQVTRSGITNAQVLHKNIRVCDEYLAEHGPAA